jgi:hypothetical protein
MVLQSVETNILQSLPADVMIALRMRLPPAEQRTKEPDRVRQMATASRPLDG